MKQESPCFSYGECQIKHQILNDFVGRLKENKSVWDSIGNPRDYCDKYLIDYVKKDTSILGLFRTYLPAYFLVFCAFFLIDNYLSLSQQMRIDSSMIEISSESVIKNLSYPILGLIQVFDLRRKIFIRNKSLRLSSLVFFIFWVFITIFLTGVAYDAFVFVIPKIYLYIGLFISSIIVYVKFRSENY